MKSKYQFGVLIGRFQPIHNAHLALMLESLEKVQKLIILVGSVNSSRNIKNPFTFAERSRLIVDGLINSGIPSHRFKVLPVMDYFYNENKWQMDIQNAVAKEVKGSDDIALFGCRKDDSSYYLLNFPRWHFEPSKLLGNMSATSIRQEYFESGAISKDLPDSVRKFLQDFSHYDELKAEYEYLKDYHKQQEVYPWHINFVTVDAVVIRSGHVLLVKRGQMPGKGLYALPGGFLNKNESILDGTLRELKEETMLPVLPKILRSAAIQTAVFDYPERSLRGRTITHATLFNLEPGSLLPVSGQDDAADALWMTINEAISQPEMFMDDHWHILHQFTMRY